MKFLSIKIHQKNEDDHLWLCCFSGYTLYRNDGLGGVLRFSYEGDMDGTSTVNLVIGGLVENRQCLGGNADVPCIFFLWSSFLRRSSGS